MKPETDNLPTPQSRSEKYLAAICGLDIEIPDHPISRIETYLKEIAENNVLNHGSSSIRPPYIDEIYNDNDELVYAKICGEMMLKTSFSRQPALETVIVSSSPCVKSIAASVFSNCDRLKYAEIGARIVNSSAFSYCTSLEKVWIRSTVTTMMSYPFMHCPSTAVIYCESDSTPQGFSQNFNQCSTYTFLTVIYGQKTRPW